MTRSAWALLLFVAGCGGGPTTSDAGEDAGRDAAIAGDAGSDAGSDAGTSCLPIAITHADPCALPEPDELPAISGGDATLDTSDATLRSGGIEIALTGTALVPNGAGMVRVVVVRALSIDAGARLRIVGAYPLLLVVTGDAVIDGMLDASADGIVDGPGAIDRTTCGASAGGMGLYGADAYTIGGGGGALGGAGGNGGRVGIDMQANAGVPVVDPRAFLRGGCPGGEAPHGDAAGDPAPGGGGGGAIQLAVGGTLTIAGAISASGGGGGAGPVVYEGGGGGGSGGTVWIEATNVRGDGAIVANGGSGGSGRGDLADAPGTPGSDGSDETAARAMNTASSDCSGGRGGLGGAGVDIDGADGEDGYVGADFTMYCGSGGGGGGVGQIVLRSNSLLFTGTSSPDAIVESL